MRRRPIVAAAAGLLASGMGAVTAWAAGIEPHWRLTVARYDLRVPSWTGAPLTIALVTDLHACEPFMPLGRIEEIVAATNALGADLVLLGGDYVAGLGAWKARDLEPEEWAAPLGALHAPLGVWSVLGNHDWWAETGPGPVRAALEAVGIPVLENQSVPIAGSDGFWLAGLGDQLARRGRGRRWRGVDDLPGTLAQVEDDRPVVLLAHEPDIFRRVDERVSLTLAGHTHGGQVWLPGVGRPAIPSRLGAHLAYGHVVDRGRHLVVSSGLGLSGVPVRFLVPPEIALVTLQGGAAQARPEPLSS